MRHLAIGDIHGCFQALSALVEFVPLEPEDVLVFLGDYVDRGPGSREVVEWVMARQKAQELIALRGNHEVMMLRARDNADDYRTWLSYGGDATLKSYASVADQGGLADVPNSHWRFLERCQPWLETDTHFFVHATVLPGLPLAEQPDYALYWEPFGELAPHESGKTVICGHTSQKSGIPANVGHAVCIDTWAYGDGWLTCLDVASGEYWQANERGSTRAAELTAG